MRILFLFLVLLNSCSIKEQSNDQTARGVDSTKADIEPQINSSDKVNWGLADTISNGISIQLKEITDSQFEELSQEKTHSKIPVISFDKIVKLGDCQTFALQNGKIDSLCNMRDGDYFEEYKIYGFWQEKNLLLASFQNWEEGYDFLINLGNGDYYNLSANYEVSPSFKMILSFNSADRNPIYRNELLLTRVDRGTPITLAHTLDRLAIVEGFWVSDNDCVVTTEVIDEDTGDPKERKYYLLTTR